MKENRTFIMQSKAEGFSFFQFRTELTGIHMHLLFWLCLHFILVFKPEMVCLKLHPIHYIEHYCERGEYSAGS